MRGAGRPVERPGVSRLSRDSAFQAGNRLLWVIVIRLRDGQLDQPLKLQAIDLSGNAFLFNHFFGRSENMSKPSEKPEAKTESAFADSRDLLPVFEVDDNRHGELSLFARHNDGTWYPICTINFAEYAKTAFCQPMLLRFGYTQSDKSGSATVGET